MRKLWTIGALALLGMAAPLMVAAGSGPAAAAAASPRAAANPVLYHQPLLGRHAVNGVQLRHLTDVNSTNWSGYADINDTFQTVSGSWTEPTVTCSTGGGGLLGGLGLTSSATYSSFWVGLDGYTSSSVEQTGTDADCSRTGQPTYYAWYEMFPAGSVDLSTSTYPVSPGDKMTGMVMSNASGGFALILADAQKGWKFTFNAQGSGMARSSAEWVAEAPSVCPLLFCSPLTLANFGTVTFTNAAAGDVTNHLGTISAFPDAAISMASGGTVRATPGPLTAGGSSFTDTWNNS